MDRFHLQIIRKMISSENKRAVSVIGAGGHARAVLPLLLDSGYTVTGVYDESFNPDKSEIICGVPVVGVAAPADVEAVLAIGDGIKRQSKFNDSGIRVVKETICHPTVHVGHNVHLGESNLIFPRVVLHTEVKLGCNNIVNTGAVVEHESVIGSHNHISVGVIVCGRVVIGDNCFIGAGSVIIDKIRIASNVTVGAGSVVIRDITEPGVYVGNPARRIK